MIISTQNEIQQINLNGNLLTNWKGSLASDFLNHMGKEGWEMSGVWRNEKAVGGFGVFLYFKRPY
ncbi:hypothetical protein Cri9333_3220 [Crinalium epipsammum PCC 9333]|uniref:DUF4177 domain-containing protein n=1 Tax=Crinalium epipsammum PCC 9333 TaxID=1173022 RepID=K9W133_9CYAN|nr:hypothetical protein [Crinalium epipsammum]AFZ14053.1 hypothetical protein Cri9333_3220 [Crinalium epipsammum PCC 9333]